MLPRMPIYRPDPSFLIFFRQHIFQILGFSEEGGNELLLSPPNVQQTDMVGKIMRRKLLRAWVELGAWLENFRKQYRRSWFFLPTKLYIFLSSDVEGRQNAAYLCED